MNIRVLITMLCEIVHDGCPPVLVSRSNRYYCFTCLCCITIAAPPFMYVLRSLLVEPNPLACSVSLLSTRFVLPEKKERKCGRAPRLVCRR